MYQFIQRQKQESLNYIFVPGSMGHASTSLTPWVANATSFGGKNATEPLQRRLNVKTGFASV